MTDTDNFHARYFAALQSYLTARDEDSLAVGHELGRRALQERISMLDIIEHHVQLILELSKDARVDTLIALEFLLQALAPLDVATRGFLDGTKRYAEQRARAEGLADRDKFRTALVNALQDGFFVADHEGTVVELNDALAEIIGYPADGVPYPWPHPWLVDTKAASQQQTLVRKHGSAEYETPIRHRDGHLVWVTVSINVVRGTGVDQDFYVGTVRDITAERAFAARESAVLRLATAVAVAKSVAEVLSITLDECRAAVDVQRVIAVMWPPDQHFQGEPTIQVAGEGSESTWRELDPWLRRTLQDARHQLPLTAKTVERPDSPGKAQGLVAMLSGAGDVALWLELRVPRWVSAEDRLLITVLVGHLSLAMQHVRQFESARETSMTLQRALLPPVEPPPGFTVRYEPAVPPLEIGGDWYDVLSVDDHRIGIVVGDCVGRGLPAAAIMGQLRSSARALLLTGAQPAVLLEQLDSAASLIPNAYCTTVFLATLDTESGILQYSNAGHMPAVLAGVGSGSGSGVGTAVLTGATSVPLAVRRDEPRPQAFQILPSGSTLMLFTDGLVERKHESIDDGIARAANALVDTMKLPLNAVADAVLRELAPTAGYDDDVAMVIYRHQQAPLRIESDASPDKLATIRHRLARWLLAAGVPDALAADIVLAVNEACTNSVEHAYRGHNVGTMLIEVEAVDGEVHARVADSGSWKEPAVDPRSGGRGLILIRTISDSVELDKSPPGTTLDIRFQLPAAAEPVTH
ncbi:SpoIIE family protein phosphatase [Mycobacterium haemophilum]|uniref:Stage II sporulation protein E n=1 Tax=Mycobacterium haemophilum TaxID=29311 RepID=A0A0I9UVY3_9MYCO|nr:SpoIIE family protein phosphatase [Mycobacterium haemophilum]AKN15887.1 stage II sporulation protein E [Mycobacterium haemophilum DSM 44634]KLO27032.1 stage II sporulation protein E [Mycobacterium haemophilum]KLO34963.1 stage II sporulation protein E [Mycobacterium haemophilum]KLO40940.1 stage II sporulation protein E [Mycobacterium haemophilum]KLO47264.1 stage II sporulation protein E [Mycobacterium haemophilum]